MYNPNNLNLPDELSQEVWAFNFRPDTYLHSSWLKTMPDGALLRSLFGNARSEGRLVWYLMQRLGLYGSVFFDFSKPVARLALWRSEELERLVLYLGAMFHYTLLRRVVTRDDILKIRHILGEELSGFMQQRAPLLEHNVTAPVSFPANIGLKNRLILAGMLCLRAAFIQYPPAFWKRFIFKLEREWYVIWKRYAKYGAALDNSSSECSVLVQKIAIEIKMGVNRDGKILFN